MKCLNCDSNQFDEKKVLFPIELKGKTIEVLSEAFVCSNCGNSQMDLEQVDKLRKASADEYRKQNGLLTSIEIINYRRQLNMSQVEFAKYLNVGDASIKRWETYFIQDPSQDDHIRLKCDESYAELNFLQVYQKSHSPDIYSGYRKLSIEKIKNAVSYLVKYTKRKATSSKYLNKIIFYVDFLHFKNYNKGITGLKFIPLKYGPCPDGWKQLFSYLEKIGILIKKDQYYNFAHNVEPNINFFNDQEMKTLKTIVDILDRHGENYLYQLSHDESAFTKTKDQEFISYKHAKHLLI